MIVADFGLARIVSQATNSARRISPKGPLGSAKRQERKKRYTVVGNPYWMAPEMMKGNKYDEKVDIFSFGIVLCEIIGRVQADPDFLPRSNDFGLNQNTFREKFCTSCPEPFYKVAFLCTDLNPDKRPPFEVMEVWLESLSMHLSVGMPLPADLLFDIQHYRGISPSSSGSTTPEGISSGHRSPALEPITEGKPTMPQKTSSSNDIKKMSSMENLKPIIKVSSADNLVNKENPLKPIIKVSSNDKIICDDKKSNNEKEPISINEFNKICSTNEPPRKDCCNETTPVGAGFRKIGAVPLRKVPKNFTRNRFSNEKFDFSELLNQKVVCDGPTKSNEEKVSLDALEGVKDTATPSKVTQKYVNNSKYTKLEETPKKSYREIESSPIFVKKSNIFSNNCLSINRDIPDVVSSTFKQVDNRVLAEKKPPLTPSTTFPVTYKKCHSYEEPANLSATNESKASSSSSIVKNIIETLNRRERNRFEFPNRSSYGRSSLKVIGSPKASGVCRSGSPEEFTAL